MSDAFTSLMRTLNKDMSLGFGVVVVITGFLLRFLFPIEVLVQLWLFSVVGTIVLGLGLVLIAAGLIHFLTDKESLSNGNKPISQKEFEKKYSGISNSSASVRTMEALAKEGRPLGRKEIAEKSGLSNTCAAHVLRSLVDKGYVHEFQVRGNSFYYDLSDKGVKLSEDIKAAAKGKESVQSNEFQCRLKESRLQRKMHKESPYYSETPTRGLLKTMPFKKRMLLQQALLIFGFIGGLFMHFSTAFQTLLEAAHLSAIPFLLTLTVTTTESPVRSGAALRDSPVTMSRESVGLATIDASAPPSDVAIDLSVSRSRLSPRLRTYSTYWLSSPVS